MITRIVELISIVFNFIPATIWYWLLVGGTILFWIGGEGFFGFAKVILTLIATYIFLWILAALLPTWLENLMCLAIAMLFWWASKS